MWWCECKAATRRGASSGYSWPHHGPVVEGRCFSQVSINWRDVTRHIGFFGPGLLSPMYLHTHSLFKHRCSAGGDRVSRSRLVVGLFDFMLSVGKCWLGLFLQGINDIYLLGLGWALAYTNARASDAATELDRGGSGVRRRAVP